MKLIKLILVYTILWGQPSFSREVGTFAYTGGDLQTKENLLRGGVGSTHWITNSQGKRLKVAVAEIIVWPKTEIMLRKVGYIRFDFTDNNEVVATLPTPEDSDEAFLIDLEEGTPNSDWDGFSAAPSTGLLQGASGAIQFAIVNDPKIVDSLNTAYAAIEKNEAEIRANQGKIREVRVSLDDGIVSFFYKAGAESHAALQGPAQIAPLSDPDVLRFYDYSDKPLTEMKWQSTDPEFIAKADEIRGKLASGTIQSDLDQEFFDISKCARVEADHNSVAGKTDEANLLLGVAESAADVLVGLDPFTGTARSIYELVSGKNMVTGEELDTFSRAMAAVGIVTAGYAVKASSAFRVLKSVANKVSPQLMKTYNAARKFIRGVETAKDGLNNYSQLRTALKSASRLNKSGATELGHKFQKHSERFPSTWGKLRGNARSWHKQGMRHFRDIMRGPGNFVETVNERGIKFLEKRLADGRGMRLRMDGSFETFLD